MKYKHLKRGIVVLADGTVFEGGAAGAIGTSTGEICFNTGMTGYQEIFTDPSYFGQIITMASPHIGNYGTSEVDMESSKSKISGMICKKFSEGFSRPAADMSLNDFLVRDNVVAITDIDTRSLVKHIRENGAMNAIISTEEFDLKVLKEQLAKVPSMNGLELASEVSTKESYEEGSSGATYRVALIDLGTKNRKFWLCADLKK